MSGGPTTAPNPTNTPLGVNHQSQFVASTISFNLPEGVALSQAGAAIDGSFKGLYIQGEDPAQSDPDTHHVTAAFKAMECIVEVMAAEVRVLNDARTLPFQLDATETVLAAEDLRLKYRYLDLRRDRMREAIELRHLPLHLRRDAVEAEEERGAAAVAEPAQRLPIDELERHTEGLVCLSGCARDGAVAGSWERGDPAGAAQLARRLLRAFGPDRFRIELQRPLWRHDRSRNRWLASLAERLGVPAVATGDAHAHDRSRLPLQDAMVAVRLGATLDETEGLRRVPVESPPLTDEESASVDALEAEIDEHAATLEDEEASDEARDEAEAKVRDLSDRIDAIVNKTPVIDDDLLRSSARRE